MSDHIVALRYTAAAGDYAGVITWTPFTSKKDFDEWFNTIGKKDQEVVEEGISEERAIELCQTTPLRSYVAAAIDESTNPTTGHINDDLVRSRLHDVRLAYGFRATRLLTNR